jgi:hypothetical protein
MTAMVVVIQHASAKHAQLARENRHISNRYEA